MDRYDVQQVCMNGHQITTMMQEFPDSARGYCPNCGAETISKCPNCQRSIRGHYHVDGFFGYLDTPVPERCEHCGGSFPGRAS